MVRKSATDIPDDHVTLEPEDIDRTYVNGYAPSLQTERGRSLAAMCK
jgi:hypothetical protein